MAKSQLELMVLAEAISGLPAGTRLIEDDPLVKQHPRLFVRFSDGDRGVWRRRAELDLERAAEDRQGFARAREEAMKVGARRLPSDDAIAEAAKKAVRASDGAMELVYAESGVVTGFRLTEKELRRQAEEQRRQAEARPLQPSGYTEE